jgi:broad specificity polyphosphatase/5'/3'-nucleotidase SurE
VEEPGTDYGSLAAGYVSITPIQLDLTSQAMKTWLDSHDFEDDLLIS